MADGTAASVADGVADGITDVVTMLVGTGVDVGVDDSVEVGMAVSTEAFGNNGESGKKSATSGIQFGGSILKDDRLESVLIRGKTVQMNVE